MKVRFLGRLRSAFATRRSPARVSYAPVSRFRPGVESLEDRLVLSTTAIAPPALASALVATVSRPNQLAPVQMLPLTINSITQQNGGLVANGTLGSHPFSEALTLSSSANPADPSCPILNLEIPQGIHVHLLGLNVDTSGICLSITGESGNGNLLGNLVCGLANALNTNPTAGLTSFLGGLSAGDLGTLLNGLSGTLNSILTQNLTTVNLAGGANATATPSVGSSAGSNCNILNLSLGPVNLDVLGLNVALDNCQGGAITVSVTATPGNGNLLGNLLCNLSNLLNSHSSLTALENSLNRIAGGILTLV